MKKSLTLLLYTLSSCSLNASNPAITSGNNELEISDLKIPTDDLEALDGQDERKNLSPEERKSRALKACAERLEKEGPCIAPLLEKLQNTNANDVIFKPRDQKHLAVDFNDSEESDDNMDGFDLFGESRNRNDDDSHNQDDSDTSDNECCGGMYWGGFKS